jgi:hypothetical protein
VALRLYQLIDMHHQLAEQHCNQSLSNFQTLAIWLLVQQARSSTRPIRLPTVFDRNCASLIHRCDWVSTKHTDMTSSMRVEALIKFALELLFGLLFAVALIVKHHSELDAAMKRDIELGYTPLIVFAAVGSGHRDDIASLRTACTANGAWLHVEG